MARDEQALLLQMSADLRRLDKGVADGQKRFERRLAEMERRAQLADKRLTTTMTNAGRNMAAGLKNSLASLAPTLAAAFSTQQIIKYADSYTNLQNQLRSTGLEGAALKRVEDQLYETANRNGVAIDATAQLYTRAALSRNALGATEAQLQTLVSGTTAALRVQGVSAESASGPLLQLGQALGGGTIQAEEFNSLIDGLPVLLQAAANGSTKFGGDIGKLRAAVKDGEVTSKEFFAALLAGFPALEAQAASSTQTVGQALQNLNNQLGRFVGQTDSGLSATQRMAQAINLLANNLDVMLPLIVTLATVVGGRYVLSLTAAASATIANTVAAVAQTRAQIALIAAISGTSQASLAAGVATRSFTAALIANPLGAVLVAVTALAAGLYLLADRYGSAQVAARELDGVTGAADAAVADYAEAVRKAKDASGENRAALLKEAEAQRQLTAARIADIRVTAQRRIDEAVASRREADRSIRQLAARRAGANDRSFSNASTSQDLGLAQQTQAKINLATQNIAEANDAIRAAERAQAAMAAAANPVPLGGGGGGGSDDGKGKKASGPTAEELAAQRQMIDLQDQLEVLRARGREDEAASVQRQIDVLELTKRYEDAGFENAKQKAEQQVAALKAAEDADRQRQQFEQLTRDYIEDQTAERERQADIAADELSLRAEIARLMGDEAGVRAAEREELILRRVRDLRAQTPGLSEEAATAQATGEADRLRSAEIVGGLGSGFEDPLAQMRAFYEEVDRLRQQDLLSEQEAAAAKAQANAAYQDQRLANADSFFSTLAELQNNSNKELAALGKAAAIAQATIDGYVAVQKALASAPPPFNYALAAAVGVVAAANVAQIAGMADGGLVRGQGGPRQDNQIRALSVGEYVVNAKAATENRALLDAINTGQSLRLPALPDPATLGSRGGNQTISLSMPVDARGADMGAALHIERTVADLERRLPGIIKGVTTRRDYYRLGRNAA